MVRAFAQSVRSRSVTSIAQPASFEHSFLKSPLQESLFKEEQPVNFFQGGVGKTYADGRRIVFIDPETQSKYSYLKPGFHKLVANQPSSRPTEEEIAQFKHDVSEAVQNSPWKRRFIQENPDELQL